MNLLSTRGFASGDDAQIVQPRRVQINLAATMMPSIHGATQRLRRRKRPLVYVAIAAIAAITGAIGGGIVLSLEELSFIGGAVYAVIPSVVTWLVLARWVDPADWKRTICLGLVSPFLGTLFGCLFPLGFILVYWYISFPLGVLTAVLVGTAITKLDFQEEEFPACRQCGYNLTGNESGICPECGTEIGPEDIESPKDDSRSQFDRKRHSTAGESPGSSC